MPCFFFVVVELHALKKKNSKILQKTTTHPIQTIQHLSELSLIYFYVLIPTKKIQTDFKEIAVEDLKETRVLKLSFE